MRGVLAVAVSIQLFGAGCAVEEEFESERATEDAEASRGTHALAVVERTDVDGTTATNVVVRFVRVDEGHLSDARDLLGVDPRLPALGDCVPLSALEPPVRAGFSAELVDLGDVVVQIRPEGAEAPIARELVPRAFADVGDLVSGISYSSPDARAEVPAPAIFQIAATEGGGLAPIVVEARSPAPIADLSLRGSPVPESGSQGGLSLEVPSLGFTPRADLELGWRAPRDADGESFIAIDIRSSREGGRPPQRCAFPDRGAALLPGDLLPDDAALALTIHRIAARPVSVRDPEAERIDSRSSLVVFDFARTIRLSPR